MKINFNCPKCGGNLVNPSSIFNVEDGEILICDGEPNGSGCDFFIFTPNVNEGLLQQISNMVLGKKSAKQQYNEKVHNIYSLEFRQLAFLVTGVEWDFSKQFRDKCCVKDCLSNREYASWTCKEHRKLELEHFIPIKDGHTVWR